jgi:hypothetical protein
MISTGKGATRCDVRHSYLGRGWRKVASMLEQAERFFRLKYQLEQLQPQQPKVRFLHLSPSGKLTDPDAAVLEKAFLMQLRLYLESKVDGTASV